MSTMISTKGLAGFKMKEGDGPNALLQKDGNYMFRISKAEPGESQAGNVTLRLNLIVQDDDEKGALIYHTLPVTGVVESGKNEGEENIKRLGALLTSTGKPQEYLEKLAAAGEFDLDKIADDLVESVCYGFVVQENNMLSGTLISSLKWFIKQEKYEESRKTGVGFRRPPNPNGRRSGGVPRATSTNGAAPRKAVDVETLAEGI